MVSINRMGWGIKNLNRLITSSFTSLVRCCVANFVARSELEQIDHGGISKTLDIHDH